MTEKIPPLASKQLEPLLVSIKDIHPHPDNYKSHPEEQLRSLKASLKTFSWTTPIKANLEGTIIAGHGMYQAALEEGYTHVPVEFCALDKQLSKAYLIADNETARRAVTESDKLSVLLDEVSEIPDFDIEAVGFSDEELNSLLESNEPVEVVEDEFNPDEVVETRCKEGDLWALGSHRLLCGDSTQKEDVIKLMKGAKADMAFSDPPYNLNFGYNEYDDSKSYDEYMQFCKKWFENLLSFSKGNVIITPGKQNLGMWYEIKRWTDLGVWVAKNKMSGGKISHLSLFEPIIFYGKFDRSSRANDLFEYNVKQQTDTGDHTCPKIINFIADLIECYSKKGDTWLELFGGSGTTLMACEQTGRISYNLELDPHYCDIILSRWEQFTGQTAKKLS